jgi:hypothetical protein
LMMSHFLFHRIWVFGNKLMYVMVSITTAFKNNK